MNCLFLHLRSVPLLLWIVVFAASCSAPPILEDDLLCLVPIDSCKPRTFDKVLIDTGFIAADNAYYTIELLPKPVNSDANDHAISFFDQGKDRKALVTNDRGTRDVQQIDVYASPGYIPGAESSAFEVQELATAIGTPWYVPMERKMYFTAKGTTSDPSDYDVYRAAQGQEQTWTYERIAQLHLEQAFDAQPTISPDGKRLYFVSERAGGVGGTDIWYAVREGAQWSAPKPAGSINTLCNELSPSVSYDGKWLYFASDGHETVGGYDIFRVRLTDGIVQGAAENIGKKINTTYDELFPYQPADSLLYYSSDQPAAYGKRNLFVLRRSRRGPQLATREEQPSGQTSTDPTVQVEGNVVIAGDTGTVKAEVFWRDPKKDVELGRKPTDTAGNYSIELPRGKEYDIGAESKDKFYDVRRVNTRTSDSVIQVPTLVIGDTLILRINFPFDNYTDPYDFTVGDNGEQTPVRWQTHLDLIARSIKKDQRRLTRVILLGHTDTVGTVEYNNQLGRNRANFVRNELIKRGIRAALLDIDPKGELQPLLKREEESIETYHLRLRRVEIVKILR